MGCSESHFSQQKTAQTSPNCVRYLAGEITKNTFLFLFLFARASDFSPHVLPKNIVRVANCPCVRQYVFFFVRCRFTCLAYLGGLSFDFCECFTLFNDEALNFLTFYTQTAKAVCDACTLLPCSPIYLQGGLGGTNEPQVCDATPKRFFICVL